MVTPDQAALLIYTAGIALSTIPITREIRDIEEADPLTLCDPCRSFRREWMSIAPMIRERAPWLIALVILLTAATWPVVIPQKGWRVLRGRGWRHTCDRETAEPADGQEDGDG